MLCHRVLCTHSCLGAQWPAQNTENGVVLHLLCLVIRITCAFDLQVPMEKIFNKSLLSKFHWAMVSIAGGVWSHRTHGAC